MNIKRYGSAIIGTALTAAALFTFTIANSSVAQAQYRDYRPGYGQDWRYDRDDLNRVARNNGYRDGMRDGRRDRFSHRDFNFEDNRSYRIAMNGFRFSFGDREFYRESYRDAYRRGYEQGFRQGFRWQY